ncbi:hypothetical protein CDL15_Pgr002253 [Punica granatum]|uniref:Uncharacterized protein n=1 Tax=Punica granatum TaxID=22663 RepID=A0A218XD03_PUNGR|nr:hypothetical protein CDL15_Pgr002253 [Punica granatum]
MNCESQLEPAVAQNLQFPNPFRRANLQGRYKIWEVPVWNIDTVTSLLITGRRQISETTGASENPDPPVNDTGPPTGEDTDLIDRNQKRAKKLESRVDRWKDAKQSNGVRAGSFADVLTGQKKGPGQS